MDYNDIINARHSDRKYSDRPVEKEKLDEVLNAGGFTPAAENKQPQRIVVIQDGEALKKIKRCTPCHFNAPVLLLVCYDKLVQYNNHNEDKRSFGQVDTSIVLTHMMLEAYNLGLRTVWVWLFDPEMLQEYLHIPDNYEILGLMPIGYPASDAAPDKMHSEKFPVDHTVFYS